MTQNQGKVTITFSDSKPGNIMANPGSGWWSVLTYLN